jgi:hypothetical protein
MQGHQMTDFGRLMAFLHTLLNDDLHCFTVGGGALDAPVILEQNHIAVRQ